MNNKNHFYYLIGVFILGISNGSFAFENGCQFQPAQLNEVGTNLTKIVSEKKQSLPKNIPIQSEFEIESKNGQIKYYGTFEGFFRPQSDDFFSVIPLPILGFDVSKDRVVVYVCAHYSEKPEESHLTIYFLRGYHIDSAKLGTFIGDLIHGPSLKVKAVPATLLGISEIRRFFLQIFRYIPFVDLYFEGWSVIQRFFANFLGDVTGFGVERIELTDKFFRVSAGVNLLSPREALYSKTFQLKKPALGKAVKSGTFNSDDEDAILSALDSAVVEYEVAP